jgi:hypothetical protein
VGADRQDPGIARGGRHRRRNSGLTSSRQAEGEHAGQGAFLHRE